jgi:hypothetical protein
MASNNSNGHKVNETKTQLFVYDIPTASGYDKNVRQRIRRKALYINKSVCIVAKGGEPWSEIKRMDGYNTEETSPRLKIKHYLVPQAEQGMPVLLEIAIQEMRKELEDHQQEQARSLANADSKLAEVEENPQSSWREIADMRVWHEKHRAALLKRSQKLLEDLEYAAASFNLDISDIPLEDARGRLEGIRALNGAKATFYVEMAEKAREAGINVGEADEMPAEILADRLEDEGISIAGAREAFSVSSTATLPNVTEVSSAKMTYNKGVLSIKNSVLGLGNYPPVLAVKSHKTGKVVNFRRTAELYEVEGDSIPSHYEYKSPDGNVTLKIENDF